MCDLCTTDMEAKYLSDQDDEIVGTYDPDEVAAEFIEYHKLVLQSEVKESIHV